MNASVRHALLAASLLALGLGTGCGQRGAAAEKEPRVLILGMDGLDPVLLQQMMSAGELPNFSRLATTGSFKTLATSMPPQSPVAWANFISGADPGVHQVFDFVHRDPAPASPHLAVEPFLSTSITLPPAQSREIGLGGWRVPLSSGRTELLRRGDAWWNHLVAAGIDTTVYRMPANYPPPKVSGPGRWQCLSGMGTPDLLGTYGIFTVFTPAAPLRGREVNGGRFAHLAVVDHRATAILEGPANVLRQPGPGGEVPSLELRLDIARDPQAEVARVTVGDETVLLNEGEWSDWLHVAFETGMPGSTVLGATGVATSVPALIRLHMKQVHPLLELYVSPLNIDPQAAVSPISAPADFAADLAQACGPYYTTGIPEDSQGLRNGALDEAQYLAQVKLLCQERTRQYEYALEHFTRGCLFFYIGHTDQVAHMFWRQQDSDHPGRVPAEAEKYEAVIADVYREMDGVVAQTLARLNDRDTLIVMSDHGFATFRWQFHLNRWLVDNGYLAVFAGAGEPRELSLADVDWSRTRAYGLGLNSLFVNLRGREKFGIVAPEDRDALLREIAAKLATVTDTDGTRIIEKSYFVAQEYPGADPRIAPDLLVGYARTYRASWSTVLGGIPPRLIEPNLDRWSGDHLIASGLVPGVLLTNRQITADEPALVDLGPSILALFGIERPASMRGHNVLGIVKN